jgi:hypothetical protein
VRSGPCLCGSCFRAGPSRPRYSVIVTPPIGRTYNEQVCYAVCLFSEVRIFRISYCGILQMLDLTWLGLNPGFLYVPPLNVT